MNRRNYQKELEHFLEDWAQKDEVPRLLLHACCAPCSSYCLEYLAEYMQITVFFYNPNITREEEYRKRVEEEKRLIRELPVKYPVSFLEGPYEPERFLERVKGLEKEPEGGTRCEVCFRLRLERTAKTAVENGGFDYFTTSLTISPLKNAPLLNALGGEIGAQYGIPFLPSDFKKKNGYKRSIELSREYDLYRQDYCGCIFSEQERKAQKG
ncbi:MAG: epoxyqueuosine reductase QueH [Eubacterium sp.]|nr:epoxyqueuosine reductase QueH [Eubacterium sp.]MBQ9023537.1 epoxyqueuosine reductase QueH [Eubacterium sp.]